MLRILFSILAIVAAAITFVAPPTFDPEWAIYVPMAGLAFIALLLWIFGSSARSENTKKTKETEPEILSEKESLERDGIISIRQAPKRETNTDQSSNEETSVPEENLENESVQLSIIPEVSQPDAESMHSPARYKDPIDRHILVPILQGFCTALNAHAVGVIQSTPKNNYDYRVLGTVGLDWAKSRGESFVLNYNLFQDSETTAIHKVGAKGLQSNHLTYSRKPASITALGITAIGETGNFLIVDTIGEDGLSHPRAKQLLETFGKAFSLLLYREDPNRPRYEIISEEMAEARLENRELSLALVAPWEGQKLMDSWPHRLDKVEENLRDCLMQVDPKSRVVKFGDLLYGVFTEKNRRSLDIWCKEVREKATSRGGFLSQGGVIIGIATMTDEHKTSDDLKNDAWNALNKAFKLGEPIVIA